MARSKFTYRDVSCSRRELSAVAHLAWRRQWSMPWPVPVLAALRFRATEGWVFSTTPGAKASSETGSGGGFCVWSHSKKPTLTVVPQLSCLSSLCSSTCCGSPQRTVSESKATFFLRCGAAWREKGRCRKVFFYWGKRKAASSSRCRTSAVASMD